MKIRREKQLSLITLSERMISVRHQKDENRAKVSAGKKRRVQLGKI